MSKHISVGIDIGTYHVKVVVAENKKMKGSSLPRVIGTGSAASKGMRYGYIVNTEDVKKGLAKAIREAEKMSGITIKEAWVGVGGVSLEGVRAKGSVVISRADDEVTELDIKKVLRSAEHSIPKEDVVNRKILHHIPISYTLDSREVLGRPIGMKGKKLEAKALFVTNLEQHLEDLVASVEEIGVDVIDVVAAPIAASIVTLSKAQKIAGCVLANIGSETVSIAVFENNIPISLAVFPVGSTDITHDIALSLKVPLEEAEQLKLGGITGSDVPKKKLEDIVESKMKDIFELVKSHLKEIGRDELLPAGVIITGGGSGITTVEDLAKAHLKLPSKIAQIPIGKNTNIKDSSWSVAYGLAVLGLTDEQESAGAKVVKSTAQTVKSIVRKLLP